VGEIYRAVDSHLERKVVIKLPPDATICEPQGPDVAIAFTDIAEAISAFALNPDHCDNVSVDPVTDPPLDPCAESPPDPSIPPGSTVTLRPGNQYYFTGRRLDVDLRDTDGSVTGTPGTPLLVLAHNRARAYNLLHGRWMQRDPAEYVDGMNLYEYVRSGPERYVDPYGRDIGASGGFYIEDAERGMAIRMEVQTTINRIVDAHAAWDYYRTTGLNSAARAVARVVGRTTYTDRSLHRKYSDPTTTEEGLMYLTSSEAKNQSTVFHEHIHRLQALGPGYGTERDDEAQAWGAQLQLDLLPRTLGSVEEAINSGSCDMIAQKWRQAWDGLLGIPNILGRDAGGVGTVQAVDIRNGAALSGFHVKCRPLAVQYNLRLKQERDGQPCCFTLTCDVPQDLSKEVGPTRALNGVWR